MTSQNPDDGQPLVSHLIELRSRLLRMILWVLAIFLCLFYFSNDIYSLVSQPLQALLPESSSMIATDVASPFLAPFKLTMVVSVLLAMPALLYQIWAFIAPGLYQREKRVVLPLMCASVVLFYSGILFAYFVVFPLIFGFFTAVGPEEIQVMTDISSYLDFVLTLFFAFGFAFQIPIAVVLLCWIGITDADSLAAKRPYIIVGCFVIGMLLTPPDVLSQTLLAVPMWMLFELGVVFGRLAAKSRDSGEETS
ncbi:MAG: twin-arginine translocase subunit TatC [Porticoccaceae bacterium]